MKTVELDFLKILDFVTGLDGWVPMDGPKNGVGDERWFMTGSEENHEHEAYVNVDSNWMTIDVDGDTMYSGDYTEDGVLSSFVSKKKEE